VQVGVVTNVVALRALLLNWQIWRRAPVVVQVALVHKLLALVAPTNPHAALNLGQMRSAGAFGDDQSLRRRGPHAWLTCRLRCEGSVVCLIGALNLLLFYFDEIVQFAAPVTPLLRALVESLLHSPPTENEATVWPRDF